MTTRAPPNYARLPSFASARPRGTQTFSGAPAKREREWIDGSLVELSRNFYAQAGDGTVCYFGEDVDILDPETGQVVSHEGAWLTGGANQPGIIMPAVPKAGLKYAMERARGSRAELVASP